MGTNINLVDVNSPKFQFFNHHPVKMIDVTRQKQGEEPLDVIGLPLDDARCFEMLKTGNTTAVFQLESRGMKPNSRLSKSTASRLA